MATDITSTEQADQAGTREAQADHAETPVNSPRRLRIAAVIAGASLVLTAAGAIAFAHTTGELHSAILRGDPRQVEALLVLGANPDAEDGMGQTPLQVAARLRRTDMTRLLIQHSANVNARSRDGRSPLDVATGCYAGEVARLLLRAGAKPTFAGVVMAGDGGSMRRWLAQGASLETRDGHSATPLHWAARNGRVDLVQVLLDQGANIDATDCNSGTALCWAARGGHADVVGLLIARGATLISDETPMQNPLLSAAFAADDAIAPANVARILLERGLDPDAQDTHGDSALHFAVRSHRLDVADTLLLRGANPNLPNALGRTPLHDAAKRRDVDFVRLLLSRGANPGARDASGLAPLHLAALRPKGVETATAKRSREEQEAQVRHLLVTYGADPGA